MRATRLLLAWALSCVASADPIIFDGTFSNFNASAARSSWSVVSSLYEGCSETDDAGDLTSTGNVCVARLISCVLQALAPVADGSIAVTALGSDTDVFTTYGSSLASALASSTTSSSASSSASASASASAGSSRKRDLDAFTSRTLQAFNDRLSSHPSQAGHVRAIEMVPSDIHPRDGVAFRMNVHSDNSTLHIHHNGTNIMAKFDSVTGAKTRKRDSVDTQGYRYQFSGVNGIKMEARSTANDRAHDYTSDLVAFAYGFAYGNGAGATFEEGDVWTYEVCDKILKTPLFYGKLVTEVDAFGATYEPVSPPGCS